MSRCMPFPPPGYVWEGLSGVALKQLIEVRREKAGAEKEEEKRKRQKKKEKRSKRKEVEELEEEEIGWKTQSHRGSHKRHESSAVSEHNDCQIKWEHQPQGLEMSSLTEEFGLPAIDCGMETLGWSPESCLDHASIASFEMVRTVCDDQEALFDKPACLTTRMKIVVEQNFELASDHNEYHISSCNSESARASRELCHSSPSSEASKNGKTKLDLESRYYGSELEYIESKYRELFVNWVPRSMKCMQLDSEDLEWLFEKKAKRVFEANMIELSKPRSHNLSRSSPVFHPTARYLPQVGTYALPLTMPFQICHQILDIL